MLNNGVGNSIHNLYSYTGLKADNNIISPVKYILLIYLILLSIACVYIFIY